jgi:hypothetical protein
MAEQEKLTAFAQAVKDLNDNRKVVPMDVFGFWGLAEKPIPKLGIRVPTKFEQDRAWVGAHRYVQEMTTGCESAKNDDELLQDARTAFIAFEFCRELELQDDGSWKPTGYPAFPGPKWMVENIDTDRLGVLLNLVGSVRASLAPAPTALTDAMVQVIAEECVREAQREDGLPEALLTRYPREMLQSAFVLLALKAYPPVAPEPESQPNAG